MAESKHSCSVSGEEIWRLKDLIRRLEVEIWPGSHLLSLLIPPDTPLLRVVKMLQEEVGTASGIKSRVNRISYITTASYLIDFLKALPAIPQKGLCILAGVQRELPTVVTTTSTVASSSSSPSVSSLSSSSSSLSSSSSSSSSSTSSSSSSSSSVVSSSASCSSSSSSSATTTTAASPATTDSFSSLPKSISPLPSSKAASSISSFVFSSSVSIGSNSFINMPPLSCFVRTTEGISKFGIPNRMDALTTTTTNETEDATKISLSTCSATTTTTTTTKTAEIGSVLSTSVSAIVIRRLWVAFEPPFAVSQLHYRVDPKIDTTPLRKLFQGSSQDKVGLVVIDTHHAVFMLWENRNLLTQLHQFATDLFQFPKFTRKHAHDRFTRLYHESRVKYVRKVVECLCEIFSTSNVDWRASRQWSSASDQRVSRLLLVGSPAKLLDDIFLCLPAEFAGLTSICIQTYGGTVGLNHALWTDGYNEEAWMLSNFFRSVASDANVVLGLEETLGALERGEVDHIFVCDRLALMRRVLLLPSFIRKVEVVEPGANASAGADLLDQQPLLEWLVSDSGVRAYVVSDSTDLGRQFRMGFEGVGAILRESIRRPSEENVTSVSTQEEFWEV